MAEAGADMVQCVGCGAQVRMADADITGKGYRCAVCSEKAEIQALQGNTDVAHHLDDDERAHLLAAGRRKIVIGTIALIAGAILATVLFIVLKGRSIRVAFYVGSATIGYGTGNIIWGLVQSRNARGRAS